MITLKTKHSVSTTKRAVQNIDYLPYAPYARAVCVFKRVGHLAPFSSLVAVAAKFSVFSAQTSIFCFLLLMTVHNDGTESSSIPIADMPTIGNEDRYPSPFQVVMGTAVAIEFSWRHIADIRHNKYPLADPGTYAASTNTTAPSKLS